MKAILLKNGTVLSFGPYDVNEDDEVTQFWCHPVGQTSIDVEYESYTGVNPEEVLVQGSYYDLNTIASYVKQLTLNDKEFQIKDETVFNLLETNYDYYANLLELCLRVFHNVIVQFLLNEWDDHNEYSFIIQS